MRKPFDLKIELARGTFVHALLQGMRLEIRMDAWLQAVRIAELP